MASDCIKSSQFDESMNRTRERGHFEGKASLADTNLVDNRPVIDSLLDLSPTSREQHIAAI